MVSADYSSSFFVIGLECLIQTGFILILRLLLLSLPMRTTLLIAIVAIVLTATFVVVDARPEKPLTKRDLVSAPRGGVGCIACTMLVEQLTKAAHVNRSESYLNQQLGKICGGLPLPMRSICKTMIQAYGGEIIKGVMDGLGADRICAMVGQCGKSLPSMLQDHAASAPGGPDVGCLGNIPLPPPFSPFVVCFLPLFLEANSVSFFLLIMFLLWQLVHSSSCNLRRTLRRMTHKNL